MAAASLIETEETAEKEIELEKEDIGAEEDGTPYFVSHNLEIEPTGNVKLNNVITKVVSNDGEVEWLYLCSEFSVNIETAPSEESGYVDMTISTTISTVPDIQCVYQESVLYYSDSLYDYYTGKEYDSMDTFRDMDENSEYDYGVTLSGPDGEQFDIYLSLESGDNGHVETLHYPEEYDGVVYSLIGGIYPSETVDGNGIDFETGNKEIDTYMADIRDWTYSDGSSVDVDHLADIDILYFREGTEGEFVPYFVENDIEVLALTYRDALSTYTEELEMKVNIIADDGTPGTADLYIEIDDQMAKDYYRSELAESFDDDYRVMEVRCLFKNEEFEDGNAHEYHDFWGFMDYYTGQFFPPGEMTELEYNEERDTNGQVWYISENANPFITWGGKTFEYRIESSNYTNGVVHYCLCYPSWYDGATFFIYFNNDPDTIIYVAPEPYSQDDGTDEE